MEEREARLADAYIKQRDAWEARVAQQEQRARARQRKASGSRSGSRRSRGEAAALGSASSAPLDSLFVRSDYEEQQLLEQLAEEDRRERTRRATVVRHVVPQLPPELQRQQTMMYVSLRVCVECVLCVCVCVCEGRVRWARWAWAPMMSYKET